MCQYWLSFLKNVCFTVICSIVLLNVWDWLWPTLFRFDNVLKAQFRGKSWRRGTSVWLQTRQVVGLVAMNSATQQAMLPEFRKFILENRERSVLTLDSLCLSLSCCVRDTARSWKKRDKKNCKNKNLDCIKLKRKSNSLLGLTFITFHS